MMTSVPLDPYEQASPYNTWHKRRTHRTGSISCDWRPSRDTHVEVVQLLWPSHFGALVHSIIARSADFLTKKFYRRRNAKNQQWCLMDVDFTEVLRGYVVCHATRDGSFFVTC